MEDKSKVQSLSVGCYSSVAGLFGLWRTQNFFRTNPSFQQIQLKQWPSNCAPHLQLYSSYLRTSETQENPFFSKTPDKLKPMMKKVRVNRRQCKASDTVPKTVCKHRESPANSKNEFNH